MQRSPALGNIAREILNREHAGATATLQAPLQHNRLSSLELSATTELVSDAGCARGEVLWLDLDAVEKRYLLAAAGDGAVEIYDVQEANSGTGHQPLRLSPVGSVRQRTHPASAHRFAATCVSWYPVDSGMFVSGSADKTLRLWDTNALDAVCVFSCEQRVWCCAMSPIARTHCMVAAGGEGRMLRLADPASGAFMHTLSGHSDSVLSVAWSLGCEHQLLSGDAAGQVRLWDVRRAGSRALLDMNDTASTRGARKRARGASGTAAAAGGRVVAHDAGVTSILATPDGLHWVTGGRDARVRLWDAHSRRNTLVHYPDASNPSRRPVKMDCTEDGRWLFQPCGASVQVFMTEPGTLLTRLRQGHFEAVTSCAWSPLTQQLYTAASDGAVLAWGPRVEVAVEEEERWNWQRRREGAPDWAALDEDAWSDGY